MTVYTILLIAVVTCSAVMLVAWFVQRRLKDAGVVDLVWAFLLGVLAIFYALTAPGAWLPKALMLLVALSWSLRLCWHLFVRIKHYPEDGRYMYLREYWGERQQAGLFWFFQLQAGFAILFSLPFLIVAHNPADSFSIWMLIGLLFWAVSLAGESIADWQLARFKAHPDSRGRTCREGLWRYSRHPNYFFEWLHWFAYVFLAIGYPYWWLTLFGPIVMLVFLYRLTGIPYTEQQALRSRGDDYRNYQQTTSAFIPWFPKS